MDDGRKAQLVYVIGLLLSLPFPGASCVPGRYKSPE
ncbi:hypothetical protein RHECNPAF_890073 [Rhizobium etli CNPAF512]|nr:hypothetical protein RHECNPAF_890073 [Rhizobium etli CNPAF512]